MAQEITHESFADHLHAIFHVHTVGEPLELQLIEVDVHKGKPLAEDMRQPFSLIFQGPKDPALAEGFHKIENEVAGSFELYIIPIVSFGDRQSYQVVFN